MIVSWTSVYTAIVSATLTLALVIQAACLVLLRVRLGKKWLARPVVLLAIAAVVYHGVTEVLLLNPSYVQWNKLRQGLPAKYSHDGALVASCGLLALIIAYLSVVRLRTERSPDENERDGLAFLDWKPLGVAFAVMLAINATGKGYSSLTQFDQIGLAGQLTYQFVLVTAVLFSFALIRRFGTSRFLPVLALQIALLATIGQRLELVTTTAMLMVLLYRADMFPSRRQVVTSLAIAAFALLSITNVRAVSGRDTFYGNTGVVARITAVAVGIVSGSASTGDDQPSLLAQAANRLDSNSYIGMSLQQQWEFHDRTLGIGIVASSLINTVPSVLLPTKKGLTVLQVSPQSGPAIVYGGPPLNYLPGFIGLWVPDAGPAGVLVLMLIAGLLLGLLERWCYHGGSLLRIVLLLTMVQGAMFFERGPVSFVVALRGGLVYGLVLVGLYRVWPRVLARRERRTDSYQTLPAQV